MGRNIYICGYPKSGNTWLTRLTADLMGCPCSGFLDGDGVVRKDIVSEGEKRTSPWSCIKTHLPMGKLKEHCGPQDVILTVVRDPRDVLISGCHYFSHQPFESSIRYFQAKDWHGPAEVLKFIFKRHPLTPGKMAKLMLEGSGDLTEWLAIPWRDYVSESLDADICVLRYEDLLADTPRECRRILAAVGVDRSEDRIAKVVERQSFAQRKGQFKKFNRMRHVRFMREGRAEQWRDGFPPALLQRLEKEWSKELQRLGYPLSTSKN